jgi:hypothetical protein
MLLVSEGFVKKVLKFLSSFVQKEIGEVEKQIQIIKSDK